MMKVENIYANLPILETERMILRKLRSHDEQDMFVYCSDPEVSKYTIWNRHKTIEDTREFLKMTLDEYSRGLVSPWGIEDKATGKLIGTTGFIAWDILNSRAELGYALSRQYWNKGYMSEAVRRVIYFGFDQMNLVRIEARCHIDNIGSARVMEKSGMQFEGILRKHLLLKELHVDVKMYSVIKDDLNL